MAILIEGATKLCIARGQQVDALRPGDRAIVEGEVVALHGPSGCDKSTLLNMIAGVLPATSGRILRDVQDVRGPNWRAGHMTQADSVLPWRTAEAGVMLRLVKLKQFRSQYPVKLSGDMRKRVALVQVPDRAIDRDV